MRNSPRMALALTLFSLFTLGGLAVSLYTGVLLARVDVFAAPLLARHAAVAIPTVIFSLFTQSMVLFFFIGTGKLLKEAAAKRPDEAGRAYLLGQVRAFKARTSGLATLAPIAALVAGLTGRAPLWVHAGAAVVATLLHLAAFGREVVAMAETNRLLAEAETLVPPAPEAVGPAS